MDVFYLRNLNVRRYALAVISVILAAGFVEALHPLAGPIIPATLLLPFILIGAWYGGLGVGLAATLLNAVAAAYFLIPPIHSFRIAHPSGWLYLAAIGVQGVLISLLCEARRKSLAASARTTAELQQVRSELRARNRELAHAKANLAQVTRVFGQHSNSLSDDLACYCRVAGVPARKIPIDTRWVAIEAIASFDQQLREAGGEISLPNSLPVVEGDESQLRAVFHHLVENAIKFRRDEPLRVHIAAEERKGQYIFSVDDNGIGIVPAYWDEVFVLGRRLHGCNYPGAGVGLAIAKLIVENHGGRIWLNSQVGQGTTVRFSIPKRAV